MSEENQLLFKNIHKQNSYLRPNIRYTPVWLTVILSIITLGIYLPYWLLTRRTEINHLSGNIVVGKTIPVLMLILYCTSAFFYTAGPFFLNEIALMLFDYVDILITYGGAIFLIFYSFRIRCILIEQVDDDHSSPVLTLFFTIWYLQYRINQHF